MVTRRIVDTSPTKRRIEPEAVAEALGAEVVTDADLSPRMKMLTGIRDRREADMPDKWRLMGFDTFSSEWYEYREAGVPIEYATKEEAEAAAKQRLAALERSQPTATSGGQGFFGIQDKVFIVAPDGTRYNAAGLAWNAQDIADRVIADTYPKTPAALIPSYDKLRANIAAAITAKDCEIARRDKMLTDLAEHRAKAK